MSDPTSCAKPQPLKTVPKQTIKPQPVKNVPKPSVNKCFPTFILHPNNVKDLFNTNDIIKKTMKNMSATHKFIIQNTKPASSKISMLRTFVKQAQPHIIIPMEITSPHGQSLEFYCKCCEAALYKFCQTDNLMLTCTVKKEQQKVPMTLIVGHKGTQDLNTRELILELIKPRVTTSPVTVNLHNCETIAGMCKKIYFDISNPLTLNYVVNSLRILKPQVLILSHNNITSLKRWKRPIPFEVIDLSYNQIKYLDDLGPILRIELTEINLRGNPVCQEFASKLDYLQRVKKLFPTVQIIDSTPIETIEFEIQENYFPTSEAAEYLVDQFMEHYFTLYDNPKKRRYLQDIYHHDALFSLTSNIVDESGLSSASQRFKHHAHNLLQTKSPTDFSVGPAEIIRKICYLPQIEHDPRTFSVDILHYSENKSVMFIIHGIFRELSSEKIMYIFTRTFILLAGVGGEFHIINDMLFVSNSKDENLRIVKPFKETFRYQEFIEMTKKIPVAISKEEKDGFLSVFIELTSLHVVQATDILEKSKWNIRDALEMFIHEYRFDQIDSECFMHDEIMQILYKNILTIRPGMNMDQLGRVLKNLKTLNDEGQLNKPIGVKKNIWRKHMITLKQLLVKEN